MVITLRRRGEKCQAITARRTNAGFYGYHALLFLEALLSSGLQEKNSRRAKYS
ncbi:MAG: hypothetical protein HEQ20_07310 [Aphanizomenon flos-aquae KM1D3_PB]|uniref:hypothetical protein n=1 Tax=Aphanizomenon flos-aquae TaxID=1176 RepID=UPI001362BBCB|nr:hypothetical protein [Aphanizomenon flos-aquae]QSV70593.1 MAG: hypothetical protein HEQ20_07310 [Aphanizomenon flos-aquae KM1D3_PB]